MNWYYDSNGSAQGPLDEEAMAALVREGTVNEESLVWQPALTQWQTVRQLGPGWAQADALPLQKPSASAKPSPKAVPASPKVTKASAERPSLTPRAPTEDSGSKERGSFLRRLFKRG